MGLSPQGLGNFLAGAKPHPSTIRKMESWYERRVGETGQPHVSVADAVEALVQTFRPEDRASAAAETKAFLRDLYGRHGYDLPSELSEAD